jgi:hypothetical protein
MISGGVGARPTTRYARSGDYSIAYQIVGDAPLDLVLVSGFVSHVEYAREDPDLARFLERLASFSPAQGRHPTDNSCRHPFPRI